MKSASELNRKLMKSISRKDMQAFLLMRANVDPGLAKSFVQEEGEAEEQSASDGVLRIEGVITDAAEFYRFFGISAVSASSVREQLESLDGDVEMHVNSPGGSVFEGSAIQSELIGRRKKGDRVNAVVTGLSASAAVPVTLESDSVEIAPMAMFMIHSASAYVYGTAAEMRDLAEVLDKINDSYANRLDKRMNVGREAIDEYLAKDTFFSAEESVENGLAQGVYESEPEAEEEPEAEPEQISESSERMMRVLRVYEATED